MARSVTYSTDRENEVSKIIFISLHEVNRARGKGNYIIEVKRAVRRNTARKTDQSHRAY